MSAKPTWNDRHKIVKPSNDQGHSDRVSHAGFENGMADRIGDLFKTLGGLPAHVNALQDGFTSLSNDIAKGKISEATGELVSQKLFNALKKAAEAAAFDFPAFELTVPAIQKTMRVEKTGGKLIAFRY